MPENFSVNKMFLLQWQQLHSFRNRQILKKAFILWWWWLVSHTIKLVLLSELMPGGGKLCKQSVKKKVNYFQVNCWKGEEKISFCCEKDHAKAVKGENRLVLHKVQQTKAEISRSLNSTEEIKVLQTVCVKC